MLMGAESGIQLFYLSVFDHFNQDHQGVRTKVFKLEIGNNHEKIMSGNIS